MRRFSWRWGCMKVGGGRGSGRCRMGKLAEMEMLFMFCVACEL